MRDFAIPHGSRVPHPPFIAGPRPFIRYSSFYATGFPPGKSGVSAIFPAIKHQERGPDNRHHASFCFSQEILSANMTYAVCGHNGKSHFRVCPADHHYIPAQACAFRFPVFHQLHLKTMRTAQSPMTDNGTLLYYYPVPF